MTKYIRQASLVSGDEVTMDYHTSGGYSISYRRANESATTRNEEGRTVLKLGSGWKVIDI
jgi:hypothetical protein